MNRDEILKMEAGRELDALVAEHVMGLDIRHNTQRHESSIRCSGRKQYYNVMEIWAGDRLLRPYSTDIAAAWMVLEEIVVPVSETDPEKQAIKSRFTEWLDTTCIWAHNSKDAAYVICIGVLLAKMELDDD